MDTGRLGCVRRTENSRRKFVFMLNEVMRSQYEMVDDCLSREKFEIGVKYDKSFVSVRKAVVKQRVLQQCLKIKREAKKMTNRNLGVYSGKPLYTYSRDIDRFIAENHPRLRRHREVEKALKEGIDRGKILDPLKVPHKIEEYFTKNWKDNNIEIKPKPKIVVQSESKDIFRNTRNILPPLRGLINQPIKISHKRYNEHQGRNDDNSSVNEPNDIDCQTDFKESLNKNRYSERDITSEIKREKSRGVLILPPLQQTKQMVQR